MVKQIINTVIDGKYHVVSLLGEGGGGSVYKAYQRDLTRFVAVKMMHAVDARESDSRQRFEREVAYLARLAHENIVKTYSVGFLDDYSLYLVLEYLEGKTLARLLEEKSTMPEPRLLKIGIQLGKAVEFAHRQGIIHRDLKPQNIMVLDCQDGDPVKVLDFGLSKLVDPDAQEVQKLTRTGSLIGSVHYMSPEVCSGKQADFRSDIYSLGCVLYECAMGVPPFPGDNPLEVMYKHQHALPSIFNKATLSPLELVILKCLQKDPMDRFQSASELCRALELIMDGRGEKLRLGKLHQGTIGGASKNKSGQIGLLLLFLSLLCGLVFISTRHHLSQEHVQDKRKPALKVASDQNDERERGLKRSLARFEKAYGTDSIDVVEHLMDLVKLYEQQGKSKESEPLCKRALAIREKALGPDDPETAEALDHLAMCYQIQGKDTEAGPLFKRALTILEKTLGPDSPSLCWSLGGLASCYCAQGNYTEAKALYKRALAISAKVLESPQLEDPTLAAFRNSIGNLDGLANCYHAQGKDGEAEPLRKRELAIREKAFGPNHPDVADSLCKLADCYKAQGKYAEAEPLYKRAMNIREKARSK